MLEAEGEAQAIAIKAKANAEAVQVMARGETGKPRTMAPWSLDHGERGRGEFFPLPTNHQFPNTILFCLVSRVLLFLFFSALETEGGGAAASLGLAKEYVSMYGLMGSKSNTMFFSERPADMNALVAQVRRSQLQGFIILTCL